MPYAYQADIICDDCRNQIDIPKPDYPPPWDTDDYPAEMSDNDESDTVCHCRHCGRQLDTPLTEHGIQHVIDTIVESMAEALARGRATTWDRVMPMLDTGEEDQSDLHGKRHVEIVRGWARMIKEYELDEKDKAVVDLFLELSEPL